MEQLTLLVWYTRAHLAVVLVIYLLFFFVAALACHVSLVLLRYATLGEEQLGYVVQHSEMSAIVCSADVSALLPPYW